MLRAFRFLFVLFILAGLALLSAITTMHFAIHGAEVTIPSFKGLTVSQATEKALSLGLNIGVESRYYSVDVPEGHIVGVRDVRLSAGAGFVVAICGEIMTMPGLPKAPSSEKIYLNEAGYIEGLF